MDRILIIDAGTTSVRAIIYDCNGQVLSIKQAEFPQYFPQPGWVEHNPEEIWQAVVACCRGVLIATGTIATNIIAIGITNQRETTVVWDRLTGSALDNAIVWQDRRTAQLCLELKEQGLESSVHAKTGLLLDPYFSAAKIAWLLDHHHMRSKAARAELLFGTIDCYLLWRLTAGKVHATDLTNASRTMLFNIHSKAWDAELLDLFGIPAVMLPQLKDNCANFGVTDRALFGVEIPIVVMIGDQQAALVGQGCIHPNDAKSTYGTGTFLMVNTGEQLVEVPHLLTTIAYSVRDQTHYAIEGSIFAAGTIIDWLSDRLHLVQSSHDVEQLATSISDNGGVYLVPAFTGLGAPYWDPLARGAIFGLTRDTQAAHLARAGLEAIAYQTKDLLNMLNPTCSFQSLRVDGGVTVNQWLMQFLANILQMPIHVSQNKEATSLGAAYLTMLATGHLENFEAITQLAAIEVTFHPNVTSSQTDIWYAQWCDAVKRVRT